MSPPAFFALAPRSRNWGGAEKLLNATQRFPAASSSLGGRRRRIPCEASNRTSDCTARIRTETQTAAIRSQRPSRQNFRARFAPPAVYPTTPRPRGSIKIRAWAPRATRKRGRDPRSHPQSNPQSDGPSDARCDERAARQTRTAQRGRARSAESPGPLRGARSGPG